MSSVLAVALAVQSVAATAMAEDGAYEGFVRSYADLMLSHGRDRYNAHSPLFVTMLSRTTAPYWLNEGNINNVGTGNNKLLPGWESRYYDRAWGGGNLADHIQLHQLFDQLSAATGDNSYRSASDAAIEFTFKQTRSLNTFFPAWGEHLSWDVGRDQVYSGLNPDRSKPHSDTHEVKDRISLQLWDRIYQAAPAEALDFALGLWDHQVYDQSTGQFSRHARYTVHGPDSEAASFPRVGGWMTLAWSEAYKRSTDDAYKAEMTEAITAVASLYENSISPVTGAIPMGGYSSNPAKNHESVYLLENNLLLAAELELAIDGLPDNLAHRLRSLQATVDNTAVTKLEHNLDGHIDGMPRGFLRHARPDLQLIDGKLQPGNGTTINSAGDEEYYTSTWDYGYGGGLTSSIARLMVERFHATGDERFKPWIEQAADVYVSSAIPSQNVSPMALAEAIDLLLDANELFGDQAYFDRAVQFGDWSLANLLDGSPLPRATSSHEFYDSITGGDDLMLAMWRLSHATPVPEPSVLVPMLLGVLPIVSQRRRSK